MPYFERLHLQNSEVNIFLRYPIEIIPTEDQDQYSSVDIGLNSLSLPNISNAAFNEALELARVEVATAFANRQDGAYFNGKQYGVLSLDGFSRTIDGRERPVLTMKVFSTDYFTHKVLSRTQTLLGLPQSIYSLESLNTNLYPLRTSFGISVVVVLSASNQILLTRRSTTSSYSEGKSWIYVSATETFSLTDINPFTDQPDLIACVNRGLEEELGIEPHHCLQDSLRFYDAFFETYFHQDNIVATIKLKDDITYDMLRAFHAKDKQLEVADMFVIPNEKGAIEKFIKKNESDIRAQTIFTLQSYLARL